MTNGNDNNAPSASAAGPASPAGSVANVHSMSIFVPTFDGSYPVQDFIKEVEEAAKLGSWSDLITLKLAKSKLQGRVADLARNRHELNSATTFKTFCQHLISALHTDRPVSSRLQELMCCTQEGDTVDAYASRIRQKSKALPEWDETDETKLLKIKTVVAAFVKGLKPSLRKLVIPSNPSDFEKAISLARSHELNESLMPSDVSSPHASASASAVPNPSESALLDIQRRVASLELSEAKKSSSRGRGRGRRSFRQTFHGRQQSRGWSNPPGRTFSSQSSRGRYSVSRPSFYPSERQYRTSRCDDRCHRCSCRDDFDRRRYHSHSHSRHHSRDQSRSPSRDRYRSPSASPDRTRFRSPRPNHRSPNGYRSRQN